MIWRFLIFLFTTTAVYADSRDPFSSPISGFSDALLPILTSFEEAKVETTLRGFIVRADLRSRFKESDWEPSDYGLYLNVAVRGVDEVKSLSDHTKQKSATTYRLLKIPPPKGGEKAIVIELEFGRECSGEVISVIDKCIKGVIEFSDRGR